MDGYGFDEGALTRAAQDLKVGVGYLDLLADLMPEGVDAGFSSEVVGAAMVRIAKGSAALAQVGDEIAGKVHAANGAYDDIDNTNQGRLRYESAKSQESVKTIDQINRERQTTAAANPFEHAPDPVDPPPQPKAAEPGPTPTPPPR